MKQHTNDTLKAIRRLFTMKGYGLSKKVTVNDSTPRKGNSEWACGNLDKTKVFGLHLKNMFEPHPPDTGSEHFYNNQAKHVLVAIFQTTLPIEPFFLRGNQKRDNGPLPNM